MTERHEPQRTDASDALYQPFPTATRARGQVWRHVPATRKPKHFHAEPELNFVTGGRGVFAMGNKVLSVAPGDLLWWPPGQDHVLLDASPDFDLFVVGVSAEFSSRVLPGLLELGAIGPIQLRLEASDWARLESECIAFGGLTDVAVIERKLGDLWRHAHELRRTAPDLHVMTERTVRSLYARPESTRSEVARVARAHPTEVSKRFHHDMGVTLTDFRSRVRLLRFIEMVDSGNENMLRAALSAGFGSYSQCHRVFRRTLGCTPRTFFETSLRVRMQDALAPWEPTESAISA